MKNAKLNKIFFLFVIFFLNSCSSPNTKWVIDLEQNRGQQPQMMQNSQPYAQMEPAVLDPNYNFYKSKEESYQPVNPPSMNQIYNQNPNLNQPKDPSTPEILTAAERGAT